MDFITGLPESNGNTNILGITDRLSKSMILVPLASITAEAVANAVLRYLIAYHGPPRAITSDRGPQFVGLFWTLICKRLQIQQRLSTAYHPETDGAQERSNQEIETYLRIYTSYLQDDWSQLLPTAQIALNNRTSSSTGLSPFFLTHGYHLNLLGSQEPTELGSPQSPATQAELWLEKRRDATAFAQASLAAAQETQERHANRGRQPAEAYRVRDRVFLRLKHVETTRPSKKLDWLSLPYRVLELIGSYVVRLDTPRGIHPIFYTSLIRRAATDPLPSQQIYDPEPPAIRPDQSTDDLSPGEYRVDRILRHRRRGKGYQVLVSWTGWPEPTWEPLSHLADTAALEAYELDHSPPWVEGGKKGATVTVHGLLLARPCTRQPHALSRSGAAAPKSLAISSKSQPLVYSAMSPDMANLTGPLFPLLFLLLSSSLPLFLSS